MLIPRINGNTYLNVTITNAGAQPVYILKVVLHVEFTGTGSFIKDIPELSNVLVSASQHVHHQILVPPEQYANTTFKDKIDKLAYIQCTDMQGIKEHAFLWDEGRDVMQYYGHPLSPQEQSRKLRKSGLMTK
jgi:hypothetical protein